MLTLGLVIVSGHKHHCHKSVPAVTYNTIRLCWCLYQMRIQYYFHLIERPTKPDLIIIYLYSLSYRGLSFIQYYKRLLILCSCLLIVSLLYILFPENISLFPLISWFVLFLILQAFTNPVFVSTNSLSIVYTFSWEYLSISSHIVVCPLFNITSIH